MKKVFVHASEIITNEGVKKKKGIGITKADLGIIPDGALVYDSKLGVEWLGPTSHLPKKFLSQRQLKKSDLSGKILCPALVDCHTHLVFAGDRSHELEMRLEGKSYQDIAKAGGGILSSVQATRSASEDELFHLGLQRLRVAMKLGIGTIEIKSGYGLDWKTEKKILKVARRLQAFLKTKIDIQVTFLGAHAFPKAAKSEQERDQYVDDIVSKMIPRVAREQLADACDVFCDEGYFTIAQSRKILQAAKSHGLKIKLHADELAAFGAAGLAAELGALSADHLLLASESDLKKMARAGVVAVVLPTTALFLKMPYAPIQKMRDAGLCVALATDFNPGSSPTQHLPFVMSLACLQMGFTMAEAFAAATYGGASALGMEKENGFIEVGAKTRIAIFNCQSHKSLIGSMAHPELCSALL